MLDLLVQLQGWFYHVFVEKIDFWKIVGFLSTFLFMMRFVVQWYASERAGKPVIPLAFWLFSISGGLMLTIYGISQNDAVVIAGQALPLAVYFRNLSLHGKNRRLQEENNNRAG